MRKPDWKIWLKDNKECRYWLDNYIKKKILRKSSDESKLHLKKTDHNLNFANWILEKHKDEIPNVFGEDVFYDWVINIYYYAVYHAALALLSLEGYKSKSHSATLCFLIYHNYHMQKSLKEEDIELIASSLSKEDIEIVGTSKELREKACYDVHELFEQTLAQDIKEQAIDFINKIKSIIEK
jgi:uncharacterized protein (UPF0332 family)